MSPQAHSRINVAHFTNTYAPLVGGVERSVKVLTSDLRELGHGALVVAPEFEGAESSDDLVFRIPAVKNVGSTQFSLKLPIPSSLSERLDTFAPDIIHSHQPFMLGDTALRKARMRGIPLVFTNHTRWERYADAFPIPTHRAERLAIALPAEYAKLCNLVIAPTRSIEQLLRERGVETAIKVVPTGIEIGLYQSGDGTRFRKEHGIPENVFVAGHLGRLIPAKNLEYMIEAVAQFLTNNPQAWFLAVGEGESVEPMRTVLNEAGVLDRCVFPGLLQGREVADAYAAMSAFLFTSLTDTQGLVLVEALSAGVPVIALQAAGPSDIIEDGKHGRLLSPAAPVEEFAMAIEAALRDASMLRAWSDDAPRRAVRFERKRCASEMLDAYAELLATWPRSHREDASFWDLVQERLVTELDLIQEKASIAAAAILPPPKEEEEEKAISA